MKVQAVVLVRRLRQTRRARLISNGLAVGHDLLCSPGASKLRSEAHDDALNAQRENHKSER